MAITGIGSGLDIRGMVDALVNAERAPKAAQLARLEKATTAKFSGLGQFRSAMADFQTTLKDLNSAALFEKRTATSGKTDVFTVTADSKAAPGTFNVQVKNLAQTSKVALRGQDDTTIALGAGNLQISFGSETLNVAIAEEKSSLADVRDAINAAAKDKGLSATIVTDPSGLAGSRLVLTSTKSGTGNDIAVQVQGADPDSALNGLAFTPEPPGADFKPAEPAGPRDARVISYARDASVVIDGIAISSKTNTVSDAIEGVSISLKAAQSEEEQKANASISLTVAEDRGGVKASLKKFVDAYNKMFGTIGSLTKVTSVGGDSGQPLTGALVGDASVRSFVTGMRTELGSPAAGEFKLLTDLGISTQRDGTLKIDDSKLDKALETNYESVSVFIAGDNGLMDRLNKKVEPFTQSGGILEGRTKSLQNTLSSVDEQRVTLNRRTAQLETRLLAQFNAMDTMIAQLSGTSTYLEGVLSNLPGVVKKSK